MEKIELEEFIVCEMKPDVYAGDDCDQVRPRWWCYAHGDMDGDYDDNVKFDACGFPPGTKIILSLPVCPQCSMNAKVCVGDDDCDFDWGEWVLNKYS